MSLEGSDLDDFDNLPFLPAFQQPKALSGALFQACKVHVLKLLKDKYFGRFQETQFYNKLAQKASKDRKIRSDMIASDMLSSSLL
jgi:hypothetical protein